jgi:diguanylate cyclase
MRNAPASGSARAFRCPIAPKHSDSSPRRRTPRRRLGGRRAAPLPSSEQSEARASALEGARRNRELHIIETLNNKKVTNVRQFRSVRMNRTLSVAPGRHRDAMRRRSHGGRPSANSEGSRSHAGIGHQQIRAFGSRPAARSAPFRCEREMSLAFNARRSLQFGGALAFIVLSALSAAQSRSNPLAEAYVLGLICVSTIGLVVGEATSARNSRSDQSQARAAAAAMERLDFEQTVDATLAHVLELIREQVVEGAKFHDSLAGADRKLSRSDSYETIHEIVLTLINDNRAMQNKINALSEKLEDSRFQILRLRSSLSKAEEIGNRDGLTALGNRRFFDNALAEEVAKARDFGGDLCIALADLDQFKKINDKFGHVAGDTVLKLFAELLMRNIRDPDKAARFGGEEFAILFPDTRLADASLTVNQIHKQLESKQWVVAASGEPIGAVTASFGVARLNASESAEDLIGRADAKLYEAKSSGRNRVLVDVAGETETEVEY